MRLIPVGGDRGDIVVGWLTRVTLVLAAFGVLAYDAVAIGVAQTTVSDHANTAALAAADTWAHTHDIRQVVATAATIASQDGDTLNPKDLVVSPDGTVQLKLCRTATTLLVFRTKATKSWATQCGTGQARSVES